jgi:hypothetical protein
MEDTDMNWRKATYSNGGADACVETASGDGVVLVRDTTDRDGATLSVPASAWRAFARDIKRS